MTEVPFHATRMSARYFESTLPELVTQVARLADALERVADLRVQVGSQQQPKAENHDDPEDCDQVRDQDLQPPHA